MTYLQFHLLFIFPPIMLLLGMAPRIRSRLGTRGLWPAFVVPLIAFFYTTPWDNYLVWKEVWWYSADRVVGTIGYVPLEEYLFFLLQPVLTGLYTLHLLARRSAPGEGGAFVVRPPPAHPGRVRALGALPWFVLTAVGGALLFTTSGLYMGLILAWASPVVGLLWLFMGPYLVRHREVLLAGIIVPTLYLWVADAIAISQEIWVISPTFTVGLNPFGLPVEEAVFFLITNVLSAMGVLLFAVPGLPEHPDAPGAPAPAPASGRRPV
jgi:lycopene cyclase domain-containing protein